MTVDNAIKTYRNEWIVYAYEVLKKNYHDIAEKVSLAVSTVRNYVRKFSCLLKRAQEVFDVFYFKKPKRKVNETILMNCDYDIRSIGQQCYLFRFYDANDELVCSKVGTTKNKVRDRLMEELRSKTYSNCTYAIVDRVYKCGNLPAEGLESQIRADYIKKYPEAFKKNDRFIKTEFDFDVVDEIAENYLKR